MRGRDRKWRHQSFAPLGLCSSVDPAQVRSMTIKMAAQTLLSSEGIELTMDYRKAKLGPCRLTIEQEQAINNVRNVVMYKLNCCQSENLHEGSLSSFKNMRQTWPYKTWGSGTETRVTRLFSRIIMRLTTPTIFLTANTIYALTLHWGRTECPP